MDHKSLGPLIIGITGAELNSDDIRRIRHPKVGGVILFTRNFESLEQLSALTKHIHSLTAPPVVIYVDHEGGRVQRFTKGFTQLPTMQSLGIAFEVDAFEGVRLATQVGFVLASELRVCGVDMSFTPVLDLNYERSQVIGTRSFSRHPEVVATLAKSLLHGMSLAGMSGCGKHFPGHGWAIADSHTDVPVDDRELSTIFSEDIAPYIALGSLTLSSVMPAHVIYSKVDQQPAGFSKVWIQDILRKQLDYQGVIISDDLGMAGAFVAGDVVARARAALSAGCDAALLCNELEDIEVLLSEDIGLFSSASARRILSLLPKSPAYTKAELDSLPQYQSAVQHIAKLI